MGSHEALEALRRMASPGGSSSEPPSHGDPQEEEKKKPRENEGESRRWAGRMVYTR